MKKKLLQINVTANWGSTGKIAEQIGLMAMERGWESYIAYGRMMNPSKSTLIKIGNQWDVYLHYAMSRFFDMEGLMSRRATRKLVQEINRIKPDVIHLHNIHDHYLNYPLLFEYLSKSKIPVVWTQHDMWAITGGCCYVPNDCKKWKKGCHKCEKRRGIWLDRSKKNFELKRRLFEPMKDLTIVTVSKWLGGEFKESFWGKGNIRVIHNGIDINTFSPHEVDVHVRYGIVGKKIVLGVASEWSNRKGLDDFYRLAERLQRDEYVIMIVGKLLMDNVKVPENGCQMIFIDRTQNSLELAQLYTEAAVFVNPTYQDNYPTTNLEAMACGTPVITYKTGGSPEAVSDETGYVVEQGNVAGLCEAVTMLSGKALAEECRKRAELLFDGKRVYNEYVKLYARQTGGVILAKGQSSCWGWLILGVSEKD
ncbi:MAG: glycosyltransferase [Prevotella sp.]|nr:glycosyltransferase [Prevotella sp.]